MSRTLKNSLMITIIVLLFICSILTIYNEIKCSNNCSSYDNKIDVFDFNIEELPGSNDLKDLEPTPQKEVKNKKDTLEENEIITSKNHKKNNRDSNNKRINKHSQKSYISISSIIMLIIQSTGISLTTIYLIISKFNKENFKKTFDNNNNKIIFSISSIVMVIFLVVMEIVITNIIL